MSEWILQLDPGRKSELGSVHYMEGLSAREDGGLIWLKYVSTSADLPPALRQLPVKKIWRLEGEYLFELNHSTPSSSLPAGNWLALPDFLPVYSPISAMPGTLPAKAAWKLSASDRIRKGDAIVTSLAAWQHYAATASSVRLDVLRFAVSAQREVLIMGEPLPPIPGIEYWLYQNILIPSGFDFENDLVADILCRKAGNDHENFFLINENASLQKIPVSFFVAASRSAVRMTYHG